ncbi:MAG: hypothetical protein AAFP19_14725, partial [Bacteroidota bacterium]
NASKARELEQRLTTHQLPIQIYLGEKDQVISPKAIAEIVAPYTHIEVNYVKAGHRLFGADLYTILEKKP